MNGYTIIFLVTAQKVPTHAQVKIVLVIGKCQVLGAKRDEALHSLVNCITYTNIVVINQ